MFQPLPCSCSCLWGSMKAPAPDPRSDVVSPACLLTPPRFTWQPYAVHLFPGCAGLVPLPGAISFPTLPSPASLVSGLLPGFEPHLSSGWNDHPSNLSYLNPTPKINLSMWGPSLCSMLATGISWSHDSSFSWSISSVYFVTSCSLISSKICSLILCFLFL